MYIKHTILEEFIYNYSETFNIYLHNLHKHCDLFHHTSRPFTWKRHNYSCSLAETNWTKWFGCRQMIETNSLTQFKSVNLSHCAHTIYQNLSWFFLSYFFIFSSDFIPSSHHFFVPLDEFIGNSVSSSDWCDAGCLAWMCVVYE